MIALRALVPFTATASASPPVVKGGRCGLCGAPIGDSHRHVIESGVRGVQCTCQACAILFMSAEAASRFRTVPDRVLIDPAFAVTPQQWVALGIPVGLAFFVRDSARDVVTVCYPGPAGITDADVDPSAWEAIAAATALATELEHDVEALLVYGRRGAAALQCYLVPISAAFELAGRLRTCWEGFSGGDAADHEIAGFFNALDQQGQQR